MKSYADILCVALPSWSGAYAKSTVELMKQLSHQRRVLYVEYAYTWLDVLRSLFGSRSAPVGRILGFRKRLFQPDAMARDLFVLTLPPILPSNALSGGWLYNVVSKLNGWIVACSIRRTMRLINMVRPVMVNAFQPGLGLQLKNRLEVSATVYYCYDEISQAPWCRRHGERLEKIFLAASDLTVTTSEALAETKTQYAGRCVVVKNGVDYDLFSSAISQAFTRRLTEENRVLVGYVGSIDDRLDTDLICEVARSSPHFEFRFIGPVMSADAGSQLASLPNIELPGPASPADLPSILSEFDVAIIPFRKNGFTRNIYPMKINEYLAAGLPIVMTSFARLDEMNSVVDVADSPTLFACAIVESASSDSTTKRTHRMAVAKSNSWKQRSVDFSLAIETVI